jgi:hypothetical protein
MKNMQSFILRMIDCLVSLIMRVCISFSSLGLFILEQDAHDHMLLSRTHARGRARACALPGARAYRSLFIMCILQILQIGIVKSQPYNPNHRPNEYRHRLRNLLTTCPSKSDKMSLCLFTWGWLKSLLALFFFSPLKMAFLKMACHAELRQPFATGSSDYRLERGKRKSADKMPPVDSRWKDGAACWRPAVFPLPSSA